VYVISFIKRYNFSSAKSDEKILADKVLTDKVFYIFKLILILEVMNCCEVLTYS